MSPEAQALADRLREHWDELAALDADAPPAPPAALDLLRRLGYPLLKEPRRPS
jgi:hypothetical protein